jgi:hypothetical protein
MMSYPGAGAVQRAGGRVARGANKVQFAPSSESKSVSHSVAGTKRSNPYFLGTGTIRMVSLAR